MRLNMPVTNVDFPLDGNRSIFSTTDLKGNITYVNPYFVEVSGFTEEELIGAPQNIVRHPDMPAVAFADLWATIKSGQAWTGMVKNRRKNGDHYWVLATVTPVMENGAATGYISVRTKPTRQQIDAASKLYSEEKASPGSLVLRQGRVLSSGLLGRLMSIVRISLGLRIAFTQTFMLAVIGILGWVAWNSEIVSSSGSRIWLGALLALAVTVTASFWHFLKSKVVDPIKRAGRIAQNMAGGDLTATIEAEQADEAGQMLRALRQLNTNLNCVVGDIRENFKNMQSATSEIAVGNKDLSGRTDSQAAALEETAASMEQLAATVQKNAEHTTHGGAVASSAMATAKKGGEIMTQVVTTIADISESSAKISDIVGIINGIASQTNLLALNAAVEAARAGEAGRGFAVVATEVRALAQRSATAAKDIKHLIDTSVEKVNGGKLLAHDAGATMEEIIAAVNQVTSIMTEISSASGEQSSGISEVNGAVMQMDEVTQRNAALVEEASAATDGLEHQGDKMMQALAVFKLKGRHVDAPMVRTIQKKPRAQRIRNAA